MNSSTPLGVRSDVKTESDPETSFEPVDHPYYTLVLKMVLWGETREDVYHRLAVNGVEGWVSTNMRGRIELEPSGAAVLVSFWPGWALLGRRR